MAGIVLVPASGAPALAILHGDLVMPQVGNWVAHLVAGVGTAGIVAEGDAVTLEVAGDAARRVPDATFAGTVRRIGAWAGEHEIVVVGGGGKLIETIAGEDTVGGGAATIAASTIAGRICAAAGEMLDSSAAWALEGIALPRWTRARSTAAAALDALAAALGVSWRVLDSGAVWVGPETWPALDNRQLGYELEELPDDGTIRAASAGAAYLRPGVVVLGRQVTRVRYDFAGEVTAELLTEVAGEAPDLLPPLVYREQRGAVIADVLADGTVDLTPDDDELPELGAVPIRPGIPGAKITPQAGDRLRIGFDRASPSSPSAHEYDQDPSASKAVARVGDTVDLGQLEVEMISGVPQLIWTPPASLGGAVQGPSVFVRMTGVVTSGSPEVALR